MMWIVLGIFAFVIIVAWVGYNSLITAKMRVSEALSEINVQLKRRTDLIPNLVETVKGYVKHEREVLEEVTKARTGLMQAQGPEAKAKANNQLVDTLKTLFAVSENYPQLKANENFKALQEELSDTENKIAYARQFYNSTVMDYNTKIAIFPTLLYANMMNFKPAEFFAATEEEKKPVQVKF